MGWNISHGGTRYGFSYSGVAMLRDHIKDAATRSERRLLDTVLAKRSSDPFSIPPRDARRMGDVLLAVADRLPVAGGDDWQGMARQIGESAIRAADANEPWRWS
ncbi:hypothetical protein [Streptomyces showdoensis]|uniref:DUF7739 domain-containing protein n=1 Tax=Streptomyces showdoensis TaxID=68268 RepID=A0A2P2GTN3_STREW|nr:hypothetical protein [Streptomyces showdoensis]KKZ74856.1 hypothetical protein VO63_05240 [Streptomyces showdoensis]